MQRQIEDTRNESQKLYDLRYRQKIEGKPQNVKDLPSLLTVKEIIRNRGNDHISRIGRLNRRYGFVYEHPRTCEPIMGTHKSTPQEQKLIRKIYPCTTYHRLVNRTQGRRFNKCEDIHSKIKKWKDCDRRVKAVPTIGEPTQQFKTVWFAANSRRK